jgi:hypothetical protein
MISSKWGRTLMVWVTDGITPGYRQSDDRRVLPHPE